MNVQKVFTTKFDFKAIITKEKKMRCGRSGIIEKR